MRSIELHILRVFLAARNSNHLLRITGGKRHVAVINSTRYEIQTVSTDIYLTFTQLIFL